MMELSGYELETLRKGGEFILYRGRQRGNPFPVLVLTPVAEQPTPATMLVDEAGNVRLTRFGIASQLPHEFQAPAPPEVIAGTLAYMAPEQTGRMNRSIDARSDLYSFGVTLYQMLTGTLPFAAADPLEWIHCHVARQPTPPGERAVVPETLSTITMKLLAKNAEERYQTASGLEADLRRCLAEWE